MNVISHRIIAVLALLVVVLALPETAAAFRCGNKLVKDGMHEAEVIAICGQPTTQRRLGYAIRSADLYDRGISTPGWTIGRGGYSYPVEVMVTEYVYNLGPRKFMRRILFEDGLVVSVETLGRGYLE